MRGGGGHACQGRGAFCSLKSPQRSTKIYDQDFFFSGNKRCRLIVLLERNWASTPLPRPEDKFRLRTVWKLVYFQWDERQRPRERSGPRLQKTSKQTEHQCGSARKQTGDTKNQRTRFGCVLCLQDVSVSLVMFCPSACFLLNFPDSSLQSGVTVSVVAME